MWRAICSAAIKGCATAQLKHSNVANAHFFDVWLEGSVRCDTTGVVLLGLRLFTVFYSYASCEPARRAFPGSGRYDAITASMY